MISVDRCLICDCPIQQQKSGLVAPFLAHRVWNREPFDVNLARCGSCGFVFFTQRLSMDEERRLYDGYREDDYQKTRYQYEPWYTKSLNDHLRAETGVLESRRRL